MPARFNAQRCPAKPWSLAWFCAWMLRTRTAWPLAECTRLSPTLTWPPNTVPVTTVPWPGRVKTRSTASRNRPPCARAGWLCATSCRCVRSAATPASSGCVATVANTGAPASTVGASSAAMSARTCARRSGAARSLLVSATLPWRTPSSSTMSRCSRVCGITPSSAATTSRAWSMPTAPAAMVWTNFSWPGTSMMPSTSPPGSGA